MSNLYIGYASEYINGYNEHIIKVYNDNYKHLFSYNQTTNHYILINETNTDNEIEIHMIEDEDGINMFIWDFEDGEFEETMRFSKN